MEQASINQVIFSRSLSAFRILKSIEHKFGVPKGRSEKQITSAAINYVRSYGLFLLNEIEHQEKSGIDGVEVHPKNLEACLDELRDDDRILDLKMSDEDLEEKMAPFFPAPSPPSSDERDAQEVG